MPAGALSGCPAEPAGHPENPSTGGPAFGLTFARTLLCRRHMEGAGAAEPDFHKVPVYVEVEVNGEKAFEKKASYSVDHFNPPLRDKQHGFGAVMYFCPLQLTGLRPKLRPCRTFWSTSGRVLAHCVGSSHPPLPESWMEAYGVVEVIVKEEGAIRPGGAE